MPVTTRRFAIVAALLLAGCSKAPAGVPDVDASPQAQASMQPALTGQAIVLSNATVQLPAVPGRPGVAYFTLTAGPGAKGSLASVNVAHFARAEMHESKMEGGAMTMSTVDTLPIVPGKAIVFAPAGLHVMLFDADAGIKPGDITDLTAVLADGSKITAKAKVTGQGGDAMAGMKM